MIILNMLNHFICFMTNDLNIPGFDWKCVLIGYHHHYCGHEKNNFIFPPSYLHLVQEGYVSNKPLHLDTILIHWLKQMLPRYLLYLSTMVTECQTQKLKYNTVAHNFTIITKPFTILYPQKHQSTIVQHIILVLLPNNLQHFTHIHLKGQPDVHEKRYLRVKYQQNDNMYMHGCLQLQTPL